MPYILPKRRDALDNEIDALLDKLEDINANAGDYNYVITRLLLGYLEVHGQRYEHFNTITGILGNVKMEFYRRWTSRYEEEAIKRNGDVEANINNPDLERSRNQVKKQLVGA